MDFCNKTKIFRVTEFILDCHVNVKKGEKHFCLIHIVVMYYGMSYCSNISSKTIPIHLQDKPVLFNVLLWSQNIKINHH